jgi:hypothetical protein
MSVLDIGTLGGRIELDNRLEHSLDEAEEKVKHFAEHFFGQFEELASGVGLVVGAFAGLSAAIVGIGATITALGVSGSRIADVETGFKRLSGSAENAEEILKSMRAGVVGTVNDLELMTNANKLMGAGVAANAGNFGTMTAAANVLSREGYGPLETIMSTINRAEQTGMLRRLAYIGVTGNMKAAEETYAHSIGLTFSVLSQSQKVDAERYALMQALNKVIADAGVQQLSFAQLVNQTSTAIANWVEELEKSIGTSPAVARAFIAVRDALVKTFGGDSEDMLKTVIGWVNSFADTVTKWGPIIVNWMGETRDAVVHIYTEVMKAWDAIPDWFKDMAKTALEAGAAAWVASKGFEAVKSSVEGLIAGGAGGGASDGLISLGANIAQISSVMPKTVTAFGELSRALIVLGPTEGFAAVAMSGFGTAALAAATPMIALTAIMFGIKSVIDIASMAWGLYADRQEQAAAKERQHKIDTNNMAIASEMAGKVFTDEAEATAYLTTHVKDLASGKVFTREEYLKLHPIVAAGVKLTEEEIAANKAAEKAAVEHGAAVDAVSKSWHAGAINLNLASEAFATMTQEELATAGGAAAVLKGFEKSLEAGHALTLEMKEYAEAAINGRVNINANNILMLREQGVTLDLINADKARGLSMAEIALKYGVLQSALTQYDDGQKASRKLNDESAKAALTNSGDTLAASRLQIANDLRDKLESLKSTGDGYLGLRDREIALSKQASDALMIDSAATFKASQKGLQEVADKAATTYTSMSLNGQVYSVSAKLQFAEVAAEGKAALSGVGADAFKASQEGLGVLATIAAAKYKEMEASGYTWSVAAKADMLSTVATAKEAFTGIGAAWKTSMGAMASARELEDTDSKESFRKRAGDAKAAYDVMLANLGDYSETSRKKITDAFTNSRDQLTHFSTTGVADFHAMSGAASETAGAIKRIGDAGVTAGTAIVDAMGNATKAVELASGKMVAASDIQKGFVTGMFDQAGNEVTSFTTVEQDSQWKQSLADAAAHLNVTVSQYQSLANAAGLGAKKIEETWPTLQLMQQAAQDEADNIAKFGGKATPGDAISVWQAIGGTIEASTARAADQGATAQVGAANALTSSASALSSAASSTATAAAAVGGIGGKIVGGLGASGGGGFDPKTELEALNKQIADITNQLNVTTTSAAVGPDADRMQQMVSQLTKLQIELALAPKEQKAFYQAQIDGLTASLTELQAQTASTLFAQTRELKDTLVALQAKAAQDAALIAQSDAKNPIATPGSKTGSGVQQGTPGISQTDASGHVISISSAKGGAGGATPGMSQSGGAALTKQNVMPGAGAAGGATSVTIAAGAIVMNYPIMNDPQAKQQLANVVGGAVMDKLTSSGWRPPSGVAHG